MQMPLVSVIVPCYNRAHLIEETLDSIIAQTYTNWECIIVDDGSTDDTVEVISNFIKNDRRFQFLKRFDNRKKGPSSCRNIGVKKAEGMFVIFLDSDDLLSSDCIQNRINFEYLNPGFDLYIFKTNTFFDHDFNNNKPLNNQIKDYSDTEYLELFLKGKTPFCVMGPLWRKKSIELLGGFDENLSIFEDPDLHLRTFLNSFKSKTNYEGIPDTFYRLNKEKDKLIKNEYDKLVSSSYYFCKKHLTNFNFHFKIYALENVRTRILINRYVSVSIANDFYFLLLKFKMLNFKQIVLHPIILFFIFFRLNNFKGLGYYRLTQYIYKKNNVL